MHTYINLSSPKKKTQKNPFFDNGSTGKRRRVEKSRKSAKQIVENSFKQYNMDKDGKKMVLPKDKVKENIGRSPDFSDMMMMRAYFDYKPIFQFSINGETV